MIKIHKFSNTFTEISSMVVDMANSCGMTISHYADSDKASQVTIPFTYEGVEKHIPYILEEEFCVVIRKKINLSAIGVNAKEEVINSKDIGAYKHTNSAPSTTLDLPSGFIEIFRKN